MECRFCKGNVFVGHQIIRADILVNGRDGDFYGNMPGGLENAIYDSETPYGPFQCCGCGAVYDELTVDSEPTSGLIDGWNWYEYEKNHYCHSVFIEWDKMDLIANAWAKQYFGPSVKGEASRDGEEWEITVSRLKPVHKDKISALYESYDIGNDYDYESDWDSKTGILIISTEMSNRIFSKMLLFHINRTIAGYNGVTLLQDPASQQILKIQGDIFDSGADIYVQQVNCRGVMGAGLAKQVKLKYPEVYAPYRALCLEKGNNLLGTALISQTNDGHYIANCFGQTDYGTNCRKTDYKALSASLRQVREFAERNDLRVALPYGLGSGLAGGDWTEILSIITKAFDGYGKVCIWER